MTVHHFGMRLARKTDVSTPDVLCFSHLRWDFVFQRPQHLMTRCAADRRVFFVEEPLLDGGPSLEVRSSGGVTVAVPHLPAGQDASVVQRQLRALVNDLVRDHAIGPDRILWFYTPMAMEFAGHLEASCVVYDCMDELSGFAGAPDGLQANEARLLARADLVFTGGRSLFEAKRALHPHVHAFASSVDRAHFAPSGAADPPDQASLPHPRVGFFGVIDERMDLDLLEGLAAARPEWSLVMVGPVVKIDPAGLPRRPSIVYLGSKRYEELPAYIAHWDVALLPFARNAATRFISPTKVLEYMAAGRPIVSTSIRDVVEPYGRLGLARIADTVQETANAVAAALRERARPRAAAFDRYLATTSWDRVWSGMSRLIDDAVRGAARPAVSGAPATAAASAD